MKMTSTPPETPVSRGFSLVEVTLAMAIVSLGVLSVVSTMPAGQEMLRRAVNDSIESRIAQELMAKLGGSNWSETNNLSSYDGSLWHFDSQGNELIAAVGGTTPAAAVYTAQVQVSDQPPAMPGALGVGSEYLRKVQICITDLPVSVADRFADPGKHRRVSSMAAKTSR